MRVTLWGTRGSLPSAGPDTVRYGGHTACVQVRGAGGTVLVLDAGTGIQHLAAALGPEVSRVDLLLTHLHMDHIQGLGFFRSLYEPDLDVHIWGPASTTLDLRGRLARYLSPPLFPVRIRDLPCRLTLHDVPRGRFEIGGFQVMADLVCHPGRPSGTGSLKTAGPSRICPTTNPPWAPAISRAPPNGPPGSSWRPVWTCLSTMLSTPPPSTPSTSGGGTAPFPRRWHLPPPPA